MTQTIERLMLKEHKRLNRFLDILEKELDNHEKTLKNFSRFKWNLEKHFFLEEKVIFDNFINMSGKETNDTFQLLEEHVKIIELLKILEKRLNNKIKPEIHILKKMLLTHRDFEDEEFYPGLDRKLTPEQKKQMSERIKEIVPT